jgi:hypothetical protein
MRGFWSNRSLGLLVVILNLVAAPVAHADYDPVGSGIVQIRFDAGFKQFLDSNGIRLGAAGGARLGGARISLPVTGGSIDPTLGKGRADTEGALILRNSRGRVPFRDITMKTKPSPWVAKVGGGQLKVASSRPVRSRRAGFGSIYVARQLRLSKKVVVRLNKKLRPESPFLAGQVVGTMRAQVNPQTVSLVEAGRATLELDGAFAAKLSSLFVSVTPIFPAERGALGLSMPLLPGSTLAPDATLGILKLGGDLEFLQLHSGAQVFVHELWGDFGSRIGTTEVDLRPSPPFRGKLGRVPTFGLHPGATAADPAARTITVTGTALVLQPETAQMLNEAFAEQSQVFAAGETVGRLSFAAQGQ